VTFRPEFNAPWLGQSHATSLTLNRLGEREAAAIIARLVGNKDDDIPLPFELPREQTVASRGKWIQTVSPAVRTDTGKRSDGAQPIHYHVDFVGTPQIRSRERDRQFESASLQQGVSCEPEGDIDIPVPRGSSKVLRTRPDGRRDQKKKPSGFFGTNLALIEDDEPPGAALSRVAVAVRAVSALEGTCIREVWTMSIGFTPRSNALAHSSTIVLSASSLAAHNNVIED
jgi:hypothetical protein